MRILLEITDLLTLSTFRCSSASYGPRMITTRRAAGRMVILCCLEKPGEPRAGIVVKFPEIRIRLN